jgi:hypothetical protein
MQTANQSTSGKAKPTRVGQRVLGEGDGLDWIGAGLRVGVLEQLSQLAEQRAFGNNPVET